MVRLKHRYVLFEVVYPPSHDGNGDRNDFLQYHQSPATAVLMQHKASPLQIDGKAILQAVRRSVEDHYGEFGAGMVGFSIVMKYFSNKTSTGIIRCGRSSAKYVVAALALINTLGGLVVSIRCVHISGTIKKCEQASVLRSRKLMQTVGQKSGVDDLFSAWEDGIKLDVDSDDE